MRTFTLNYPVTRKSLLKNTEICIVNIRRPRAKDFYGLNFADNTKNTESMIILLSKITNLTAEEANNIDMIDFRDISEMVYEMITSIDDQ